MRHLSRRQLLAAAVALPILGYRAGADASGAPIRLVVAGGIGSADAILPTFRKRMPGTQVINLVDAVKMGDGLLVALGPEALAGLLRSENRTPVLALYVSRRTYREMVDPIRHRHVSAIYAEVSPAAQIRLVAALFGRRISVGAIFSEGSPFIEEGYQAAAQAAELNFQSTHFVAGDNIVSDMAKLGNVKVLLAAPDAVIFSAANIRPYLETAYRRGQAVVGFNPAMVKAGALATAYAHLEDTVAQVGEIADAFSNSNTLPLPSYPSYWRVLINESVATSMNVPVSDAVRNLGLQPR